MYSETEMGLICEGTMSRHWSFSSCSALGLREWLSGIKTKLVLPVWALKLSQYGSREDTGL